MVASDYNATYGNKSAVIEEKVLDQHRQAEQSMLGGKRLIVTGCVVAMLGIMLYCYFSFSAGFEIPASASESLFLVGFGVARWFWGAIKYFLGTIRADAREELF